MVEVEEGEEAMAEERVRMAGAMSKGGREMPYLWKGISSWRFCFFPCYLFFACLDFFSFFSLAFQGK